MLPSNIGKVNADRGIPCGPFSFPFNEQNLDFVHYFNVHLDLFSSMSVLKSYSMSLVEFILYIVMKMKYSIWIMYLLQSSPRHLLKLF